MQTWANRNQYHQAIGDSIQNGVLAPVLTEDLKDWLAKLTLLYGVPVEYLVPDYRMLPVESIRFFYLDQNWLDRLVDGAISVGVLSTKDTIFNQTFFQSIYDQVNDAQQTFRASLKSVDASRVASQTPGTISGLLMRSQIVTDYPGVEINGYDEDGTLLPILRMDRLSSSLLLCIFNGVPANVEFIQPSEGLHFGINRDTGTSTTFDVYLRGLGFDNDKPSPVKYPGGQQIDNPPGSEQYVTASGNILTDASEGVVDVLGLVGNIEAQMATLPSPSPLLNPDTGKSNLTPGGFAIQMVVTAQRQAYKIKANDGSTPPACDYTI